MTTPRADVLDVTGLIATVRCPYCGNEHQHTIRDIGGHRFAPGCGMQRSYAQRLAGYRFDAAPKSGRTP